MAKATKRIHCIYFIRCMDDTLYIGMSMNWSKRFKQYMNRRGSKWVKDHGFKSYKMWVCPDHLSRGDIMRLEQWLKNQSTAKKWSLWVKSAECSMLVDAWLPRDV